jgi:multidrug efflux system membrane fusion protein
MLRSVASIVLAVIVAALSGCHKEESAAAMLMQERPPANVTVTPAIARDVPVYIDEIGKTAASEAVTIVPQVTGKLLELHFTDGANVKKGDLLFTIDERPFKAVLDSAQASLAQAQAKLKYATDELARMEEVKNTGAVSVTEWEQRANDVKVNAAAVQAAEASAEQARLNLEYCQIRAPISGRLGQRLVDPGNVVTSSGPDGGTKMLTIQAFDPIYADFTITENQLGTVRKFMARGVLEDREVQGRLQAYVDVPGDAQDVIDALGGLARSATTQQATTQSSASATTRPRTREGPRQGVLTFLDNTVQGSTGTVHVRATVPNADRYFWPGQFIKVRLVLTTLKDAVLIPAGATQIGQTGPFVFVVTAQSTADMRPVQLGQRQGELIVIESGVSAGERVITAGQNMVAPSGKVKVANEQPVGAVAEGPSK